MSETPTMSDKAATRLDERRWPNLFELLQRRAAEAPGRGFYVRDGRGGQEFRTLSQIGSRAHRIAYALRKVGVEPGERVLVAQPTGFDFLATFFGLQALGARPVPLSWPSNVDPFRGWSRLARWRRMAQRYGATVLICGDLHGRRPRGVTGIWPPHPLELVTDVPQLLDGIPGHTEIEPFAARGDDVAYIQSTSGTTGAPRGVKLTHRAILSSVEAIGRWIEVDGDDVLVSWLPLDNIMGLVGVVCFSLHWGVRPVLMHAERFLASPEDWFWAISEHRATLSLAPNFAFNYCVRRCNASALEGLDLSSWRVAMNGSEPVRAQHMQSFMRRFHQYGLADRVIMPVYGLSETTLGATFHPFGEPLHIDGIHRHELERRGRAQPLSPEDTDRKSERMHVVSVGRPLPEMELQIVDDQKRPVGERVLGEIALRGPNIMAGYEESTIRSDEPNPTRVEDGWLYTGDLGYLAQGDLFFVSRASDRIDLPSGRSVFPEEVELFVDAVDGVRAGSTAVFAAPERTSEGDEVKGDDAGEARNEEAPIVVAFEVQAGADSGELIETIRNILDEHLDLRPSRLVDLAVRSVPKTPTGKVRRHHCRRLFERDLLGKANIGVLEPTWWTRNLRDLRETLRGGGEALRERVEEWFDD